MAEHLERGALTRVLEDCGALTRVLEDWCLPFRFFLLLDS
jgi:hypothetical protein